MPAYRDAYNEYSQNPATAQLTVGWQSYPNLKPYYKIVPGGIGTTLNPEGERGGATGPFIDRRNPPSPPPPQIVRVPYFINSGPSWITLGLIAVAAYYMGRSAKVK
jgi:hypothetical protein